MKPEVYDSPAEFLGDLIRKDVQGFDALSWHELQESEKIRWSSLGMKVIKGVWELDTGNEAA